MFLIELPNLTPILLFIVFLHYFPQISPNMDVLILDTYINFYIENEDTKTKHIKNQAYKHQQK